MKGIESPKPEGRYAMAHEIFGERFLGVRKPAWHRLGTVIEEAVPASDAIRIARLDYAVVKQPLFLPDGQDSGYSAIVREATEDAEPAVFGVGKRYDLVHINEIVHQLDSFPWPITSAGALRNGAEVFICYDLGDKEVLGEHYHMNLAVAHPYEPGQAWRAMLTPTRVVCQNTLTFAESNARGMFRAHHGPGAKDRIDAALVQAQAEAAEERAIAAMKHLQTIRVDEQGVERAARYVKVIPRNAGHSDDAYKRIQRDYENYRVGVVETYNKFCDEHTKFAGTGYALYNAMVEWSDWRDGRGQEAKIAEASIIGNRAAEKKLAYKAVASLA